MAALTAQVTLVSPVGYCARLENQPLGALLKLGLGSGLVPTAAEALLNIDQDSIRDQALSLALRGYVELRATATTETNDTVVTLNLSDLGVDFPAATMRRIDLEAYITADADAGLLRRHAMVAGGTTPLVALTDITFGTDAATATKEGGNLVSVARGDFLGSSLIVPDVKIEQNTNKIRLSITGVTNLDMFWTIAVKVYPKIAQTFPVTD
jgi:hypothetical protein